MEYSLSVNTTYIRWELEKGMATHPSILAWEIPWTEQPGPRGCRVGHDWMTERTHTHACTGKPQHLCNLVYYDIHLIAMVWTQTYSASEVCLNLNYCLSLCLSLKQSLFLAYSKVIQLYMCIYFHVTFCSEYWIQFPVLRSRSLFLYFIYSSLHLIIPNSWSIPPHPLSPLVIINLFPVSVCLSLFCR